MQSSLTEVRRAKLVTLYGKGYTEYYTAANLHCFKTMVHNPIVRLNADGTFHDRKRSGRPQKIVMRSPKSSCKKIRANLRLKSTAISSSTVSRCLSKAFWTKATPDTSDEEKGTGHCEMS